MTCRQNMKFLRQINLIPKNWKDALKLWRFKQKYPNKCILCNSNGRYYYTGLLLQLRDDNNTSTYYYQSSTNNLFNIYNAVLTSP